MQPNIIGFRNRKFQADNMKFCSKSCLLLLFLFNSYTNVYAHIKAYADITPTCSDPNWFIYINGVNNKGNAATTSNSTSADLYTFFGDAWLQLKYTNVLSAGTTSFIRVDVPGFTLSSLIGDAITVDAYNNATASSNGNFVSSVSVSIVYDQNYTYLAVTPSVQYNSLRVKLSAQSIQYPPYVLNVFYSFYNISDAADCGNGWTADIGEKSMGAAPASNVSNPKSVIDDDKNTYSKLQLTANQQNIELSQTIYFPSSSYLNNVVKITASVSSLFNSNNYTIHAQAYHGLTPKGINQNITALINTTPNSPVDIYINPGSFINRVKITIKANNNGNLAAHVNLHEVDLVPEEPILIQNKFNSCPGDITLQIKNPDPGLEYLWYDNDDKLIPNTSVTYKANFAYSVTPYAIKVTARKRSTNNCTNESAKTNSEITINRKPDTPEIITAN